MVPKQLTGSNKEGGSASLDPPYVAESPFLEIEVDENWEVSFGRRREPL
jgi:hypothetical protein